MRRPCGRGGPRGDRGDSRGTAPRGLAEAYSAYCAFPSGRTFDQARATFIGPRGMGEGLRMGRRPSVVPVRARGLAACACLIAALLLTAASASGKKPPWAHGQGNPHKGHDLTATSQSPTAQSSIQTVSGKKGAVSYSPSQPVKGHGHGKGHNKGQDAAAASAPASAASSSTSSTPAPSAGTSAPQATAP